MRSWYATWDSSSSMSNLSASAPPFTVAAPSAPSPDSGQNMDSGDPLRFPVNSSLNSRVSPNPTVSVPDWISGPVDPELDRVNYAGENPYSSSYPYGDFSGGSRNSAGEVRIYYPEYPQYYFPEVDSDKPLNFDNHPSYGGLSASRGGTASAALYHDQTNAFSSLSSSLHVSDVCSEAANRGWHESAPFWSAQNNGADGSVHRSYEPQASHSFEGLDARTEVSNDVLNRSYRAVSTTSELVEMNLFPGNNIEVPIDSPPTALSGSTSVLSQAYSSAPPLDFCVEPRNYQMGYNNLVDKCSGEQFSSQGNGYSVIDNALSSARPPIAAKISERNALLDATQHRAGQGEKSMGIGRFRFGNGDYLKNETGVSGDASDGLSTAVSRLEVPYMVLDGLNIAHESNHAFISSDNVSEALNQYGHTVDSPCWKGVSIKRFGSSKACEVVAPNHVSEFKDLNFLNPPISQVSAEKDSELNSFSQRQRDLTAQDRNMISGKNSARPVEQTEVQHSSAPGVGFGDVLEVGPCHLRPSYSCRNQGTEDVNAPWKRNASIDKLASDVSVKLSKVKRNSHGHDVTSKEKQASLGDGSDLDRKINDAIDIGLSDVSMRCVEHVLSSPPSTMEATAKQSNFHGEELAPRIDVPLLVKTMLNLSELLLLHNSNGTSDLKEQDYEVLRKVANNLEACCLKDVELVSRNKESSSTVQDAPLSPLFHGVSLKHQKNKEPEQQVGSSKGTEDQECPAAENMQSSSGVMPEKDGSNPYSKLSQMGIMEGTQLCNQKELTDDAPCNSEKHSVLPGLPEDDKPDNLTNPGLADFVKQDKITQDIKRILMENFHDEVGSEPQTHLFKNLWLEAEAALCSVNYMARYNHAKLHMAKSKPENEKDANENATPVLTNLWDDDDKSNLSIPRQRSMDATDDVLDRFNILKALMAKKKNIPKVRESDSDYMSTHDVEEVEHQNPKPSDTSPLQSPISRPECSSVMERFSILKQREDGTNSTKLDGFATRVTDFPTNQASDITESSVMARLSILKRRDDVASLRMWNVAALEAINLESAVQQDYFPEENSSDCADDSGFLGYALLPQDTGGVVDGSTAVEQTNASLDGAPLEWEHVQREDINVQNP